jgi:D-glycero-D-manno-heptose 1,7-bisphosphate phosphatase
MFKEVKSFMNRAVFLDRDGTIIKEIGYLRDIKDIIFIDGAIEAIRRFNNKGFRVIVTTNQSGIARGFLTEEKLREIHDYMAKILNDNNACIDEWLYCPHHLEGVVEKYRVECDCRKPRAGMILTSQQKYDISLENSFVIGDSIRDIKLGINAGVHPILVLTGYGKDNLTRIREENISETRYQVAKDILDASGIICASLS